MQKWAVYGIESRMEFSTTGKLLILADHVVKDTIISSFE